MAKQQRTIRLDQRGQQAAMEKLVERSDEELMNETRFKAQAQAILGQRAAERYDAKTARAHFQKALTAARPQERLQIRRMADMALALAERRASDFQAASAKLGANAPTKGQMRLLRIAGLIAPPSSAGIIPRIRGILIVLVAIILILAIGFGIVSGIAAAAGGLSIGVKVFWTIVLLVIVIGGLIVFGRRRQKRAKDKQAEELAARKR